MSPILVRPVREQLEHDRIIRLLQAKHRRRYEVGINPGAERNVSARTRGDGLYPDLVLQSQDRGHRVLAAVEVETGESVNHLESLAEWVPFGSLRTAFILYVPSFMVDVARRLCLDMGIRVNEIWSYHVVGDEIRFTLVDRNREVLAPVVGRATAPARGKTARPKTPGGKGPQRKSATAKPTARRKSAPSKARPHKSASVKRAAARPKAPKVTKRATASKKRAQKRK